MLLSGCNSSAGILLAKALAKQTEVKSFEYDSEMNLAIDIDSPSIQKSIAQRLAVDIFKNINIKAKGASNQDQRRHTLIGQAKLNGLTAEYESYMDNDLVWVKYPVFSKYISVDMGSTDPEFKEKYGEFQKKLTEISKKFLKDYILGFKYNIDQIKNNGTVSIKINDKTLSATEITVSFNEKQAQSWISYAIKDLANKDDFTNAVIEAVKLIDDKVASNEEELKKMREDIKSTLSKLAQDIDPSLEEAFKSIEFGNNGAVFKFYVDNNDNIIRTLADLDIKITNPNFVSKTNDAPSTKEQVEIKLSFRNDYSNINATNEIVLPKFDLENTINITEIEGMERFNANPMQSIYNALKQYKNQLAKDRTSTFNIESRFGQIKGKYKSLKEAPYEKDGTVYISARDLADAIGIKVDGDKEKIRFFDDNKELVIFRNSSKIIADGKESNYYFAPEIVNGYTMVDYLVVTDHFKSYIESIDKDDMDYSQRIKIISVRENK